LSPSSKRTTGRKRRGSFQDKIYNLQDGQDIQERIKNLLILIITNFPSVLKPYGFILFILSILLINDFDVGCSKRGS